MKILIVCSGKGGVISPFIKDMERGYLANEVSFEYFLIGGNGAFGYLRQFRILSKVIYDGNFDLIHAHYGLSGLFANLQRNIPVVVTYHGADIYLWRNRPLSQIAIWLSAGNIFISQDLKEMVCSSKSHVVPCGVDLDVFGNLDKRKVREELGLEESKKYVLFSSDFSRQDKNPQLALESCRLLGSKVELIEMKGFSRKEVNRWMNAADCCLLTSTAEGSPQFIKEALAVGAPIVSTNVGDVKERLVNISNSFISKSFEAAELSELLTKALMAEHNPENVENVRDLSWENIVSKVVSIYKTILNID